jgi:hypothetical protein
MTGVFSWIEASSFRAAFDYQGNGFIRQSTFLEVAMTID